MSSKPRGLNIVKTKTKDLIRENNKLYNMFMTWNVARSMRHYRIKLNYEFDYCLFFINSFLTAVKCSQSSILTFESLRCKVVAVTVAIT